MEKNGAPSGEKYFVFYNPPVVNKSLGFAAATCMRLAALPSISSISGTADSGIRQQPSGDGSSSYIFKGSLPAPAWEPKRSGDIEADIFPKSGERLKAAAQRRDPRGGFDERARTGSRYRIAGCSGDGRISGNHRILVAASGKGRAAATASIAVLVASSAPLDQYIVEHPEYFFERTPEQAFMNPDNLEIAAQSLEMRRVRIAYPGRRSVRAAQRCGTLPVSSRELLLHKSGDAWHWMSDTYPADAVSLRAVSSDNFVVVDVTGDHKIIAEVAFPTALTTLHEKAIYLHESRQYQVEKFDYDGRKAFVRRVDSDYFTDAIDYTQVGILMSSSAPI